jgi:RNA polymerase sigma-70 factor (ECF subfamily)
MSPDEFAQHYRAHLPALSKFVARRADTAAVEDICSDIFLIAWQKRDQAPVGFELAWLYSIGGHVINNLRRKNQTGFKLVAALSVPNFAPSAESLALADVALDSAWRQLKSGEQQVLSLTALDGLSVSEASRVLGVSANAVSVRLNRARAHLTKLLEISDSPVITK